MRPKKGAITTIIIFFLFVAAIFALGKCISIVLLRWDKGYLQTKEERLEKKGGE